jgi:lia operon protein LiaG
MTKAMGLAAAVVLTTSPGVAQERFSLTGDKVAIYNLAGEVRVEAGSAANVVVEITRGGGDSGRLEIDRNNEGGWQTLIVRYPDNRIVYRRLGRFNRTELSVRDDGMFGMRNLNPESGEDRIKKADGSIGGGRRTRVTGSGSGLEAHADLRIMVPTGKNVAVHLGVGKIIVSNVNGDLQLDARSASIEATGVTGLGRFDTGSGSISLRNGTGNFGLHTGSGGVRVDHVTRGALIVDTGSGSVEAFNLEVSALQIGTGSGGVTVNDAIAPAARISTGSGSIRANRFASTDFDFDTGSGGVRVELASDLRVGRINTGSGSVAVATTRELGAEVVFETGSGSIDVDAPGFVVHEARRTFLRGRMGDGKGSLSVNTGSGGVSFRSF